MRQLPAVVSLLVATAASGACQSDDALNPPNAPPVPSGGALFQHYVAVGNSISAGFQSLGINDSTQALSFPVLFATQAGTAFKVPLLNQPGCPAPLTSNVTLARVGNGSPTGCALRSERTGAINNVSVPGAGVRDMFSVNGTSPGAYALLHTFFLGNRSEVRAMQDAQPTFVSIEVGPNDVLGALIDSLQPGDPNQITAVPVFSTAYQALLDSVEATGAKAVLVTVPDVTVIPFASTGSTYWCIKNQPACGIFPAAFPPNLTVDNNCAPDAAIAGSKGDSVLVPWPVGVTRVLLAAQGQAGTIDCSVDTDVILPAEYGAMRTAVQGFNDFITAEATARGWAVLDLNGLLMAAKAGGQIPPFPDLSAVGTGGNINFGPLISLDGFHPSSAAHKALANAMITVVNTAYGSSIPPVP